MLSEKSLERINVLLDKVTKGSLSGGGELQRQIFISGIDQIISEEKIEYERKIIALQSELTTISESAKHMQEILRKNVFEPSEISINENNTINSANNLVERSYPTDVSVS